MFIFVLFLFYLYEILKFCWKSFSVACHGKSLYPAVDWADDDGDDSEIQLSVLSIGIQCLSINL